MNDEMLLRLGYYCGVAYRVFGDDSYALRFLGSAELVTPVDYAEMTSEISARLIAGGYLSPDEDLWEKEMRSA